MPQPKFLDLRLIYRRKAQLLEKLEKYVKPIHEFKNDPGMAEFRQQEDHVILEHHHFSSDKGLLPLVYELIAVNDEILSYESPDFVGQRKDKYDKMLESVKKEQNFLKMLFKPTLEDVVKRKGYKEYWEKSFSGYKKLLERVQLSLTYLLWLLHIEAAAVVSNILDLISHAKLDEVIAFIKNDESAKLLSEKEVDFFKKLISAVKDKRYDEIDAILEEGRELIEKEEYQVLIWIFHLDIEITSINSGEAKESIEIKAGDEITITANVKCGFIPAGCKAFLRIPKGDDKPWIKESVMQTVDRSKRTGTLQYQAAFEFKLETSELIDILNEAANGHIFIVAQSQLCKKTKQVNVKINPNHAERIRMELEKGPATDIVPSFRGRKRFKIEDEPKNVQPTTPTTPSTPKSDAQTHLEQLRQIHSRRTRGTGRGPYPLDPSPYTPAPSLSEEDRRKIETIKKALDDYSRIIEYVLSKNLTAEPTRIINELKKMIENYKINVAGWLDGSHPIENKGQLEWRPTFQDLSIGVIDQIVDDLLSKGIGRKTGNFLNEMGEFTSPVNDLLSLGNLQIIMPKIGEQLKDNMEWEPVAGGTLFNLRVGYVSRAGYASMGNLLRPARIRAELR